MNKKILLPLLILGLGLSACTPVNPGPESQPDGGDSNTTESEVETPIWEEELVEGETAISELINGTDGDYYMVRGTVVGRSGSTMALARGDDFVYCYNFKANAEGTSIAEYETGNYVEVYGQISHYEGSVQLTAYVGGAYDTNAYVEVLETEGETIAPTVLNADNFSTVHVNTNAGKLLKAEGLVNVSGAYTATGTANEDAKFKLGENDVTVRLEKYFDTATRADFVATLDALEATATYTIVAIMTASSGGGRLMLLDSSTVTKTADAVAAPEEKEEPAKVTVTTIAEATAHTAAEMTQKFHMEGVEVASYKDGSTSFGIYGNMNITDGTTTILVYGATATASALTFNTQTGEYAFNNPKDFESNALTSTITLDSTLDIDFVVTSYKGTKQLYAIVLDVHNSTTGTEPEEPGGDVTPSGETLTWAWGEPGGTTVQQVSFSTSQVVYTSGGVTLTNDKGASTSAILDGVTNGHYSMRVYKSSDLTISADSAFVKIEFTFDDYSSGKYIPADGSHGLVVSGATGTLVLSEATTSYTISTLVTQVRIKQVVLTLAA